MHIHGEKVCTEQTKQMADSCFGLAKAMYMYILQMYMALLLLRPVKEQQSHRYIMSRTEVPALYANECSDQ